MIEYLNSSHYTLIQSRTRIAKLLRGDGSVCHALGATINKPPTAAKITITTIRQINKSNTAEMGRTDSLKVTGNYYISRYELSN